MTGDFLQQIMENKKEEQLVYYLDVHLGSEGQICELDVQMNAMSLSIYDLKECFQN